MDRPKDDVTPSVLGPDRPRPDTEPMPVKKLECPIDMVLCLWGVGECADCEVLSEELDKVRLRLVSISRARAKEFSRELGKTFQGKAFDDEEEWRVWDDVEDPDSEGRAKLDDFRFLGLASAKSTIREKRKVKTRTTKIDMLAIATMERIINRGVKLRRLNEEPTILVHKTWRGRGEGVKQSTFTP